MITIDLRFNKSDCSDRQWTSGCSLIWTPILITNFNSEFSIISIKELLFDKLKSAFLITWNLRLIYWKFCIEVKILFPLELFTFLNFCQTDFIIFSSFPLSDALLPFVPKTERTMKVVAYIQVSLRSFTKLLVTFNVKYNGIYYSAGCNVSMITHPTFSNLVCMFINLQVSNCIRFSEPLLVFWSFYCLEQSF